jgi:hypothetical protein
LSRFAEPLEGVWIHLDGPWKKNETLRDPACFGDRGVFSGPASLRSSSPSAVSGAVERCAPLKKAQGQALADLNMAA